MRRSVISCGRNVRGFTSSSAMQSPREKVVENILVFKKLAKATSEGELATAAKTVKIDSKAIPAELKGANIELYLSTPQMVIFFFARYL